MKNDSVRQANIPNVNPVGWIARLVNAISEMVGSRNEIKDRDRWDRGTSGAHLAIYHKKNTRSQSYRERRKKRNKTAAESRRINWRKAA